MGMGQGMLPRGGEKPPETLSTLDKTQPQTGLAPRNK